MIAVVCRQSLVTESRTYESMLGETVESRRAVISAELRPPRAELATAASMDAWIDTYHAVKSLTRDDTFVFLTDSAVGLERGRQPAPSGQQPRERRAALERRAIPDDEASAGVLPGVRRSRISARIRVAGGAGRRQERRPAALRGACVAAARAHPRAPADLALGGWANPHADAAAQVRPPDVDRVTAEFYLTQIVSHHSRPQVERFLEEAERQGVALPGLFGVFYYRSANRANAADVEGFLPVPVDELTREFGGGASAEEVCARSIRELRAAGVRHFYISNLPLGRAAATLDRVMALALA